MDDGWDGSERRAAALAAEAVKSNGKTVEVPLTAVIIGFAAMILLQIGGLIGHAVLSGNGEEESDKADIFRRSVSCFLFEIARPTTDGPLDRADILARCGLIGTGPGPLQQEEN
jgi:hypothetical protein